MGNEHERVEDIILAELREFRRETNDRFEAYDQRINALEKWRAYLVGAWAVVVVSASLAWMGLKEWVKSKVIGG